MMWWNHAAWGAGDWLATSLIMVAFWGVLIASVVWLVRGFGDQPNLAEAAYRPATPAEEVLAERFPRGEIDEDDFTRRRDLLRTSSVPMATN
jgi:putative membrane protein